MAKKPQQNQPKRKIYDRICNLNLILSIFFVKGDEMAVI